MVPEGAILTSNGCDRQRHESTITTREPWPSPDLSHRVVCCDFSVGVGHCGRFGFASPRARSLAIERDDRHVRSSQPPSSEPWRHLTPPGPARSPSPPASESVNLSGGPSLITPHWNVERERRTHAHLTLGPDPLAVEFHELPAQRQPQARALCVLVRRPHLAELLEHVLLVLRRDANPGVADRHFHRPISWYGCHLD